MSGGLWEPAPPDGEAGSWRLDQQSRRAVRWFLLRLWTVLLVALLGAFHGDEQLARAFLGLLSLTCAVSALVCAAVASLHGEAFARGGLNAWDEALGFLALSRLAHFAFGLALGLHA